MNQPSSRPTLTASTQDDNGFSRIVGEHLDSLLLRYAGTGEHITVCGLRDQLLKMPELEQACPNALRLRVRDRIRTLQKHGLARKVTFQDQRRPVYVLDIPTSASSNRIEATPSSSSDTEAEPSEVAGHGETEPPQSSQPPSAKETESFTDFLDRERHRLKLDMQSVLGEASHYSHILASYPERRPLIEPLHQAACQRGSEVKGALDAVVKLRQAVDARGNV